MTWYNEPEGTGGDSAGPGRSEKAGTSKSGQHAAGPQIDWTSYESMLWETARVVGAVLRNEELPYKPCNFALSLGSGYDEVLIASAPFCRDWLGAIGNGDYQKSTTFVGGFSPVGVMLGAATLGASAIGNARRKSAAAAAASVVWRQLDAGLIHITTKGFYLEAQGQISPFGFWSIQRMDLIGPGNVQWSASMADGTSQTFRFASDAAEMAFVLWALACCPYHSQLHDFTWLPREFMDRVRYAHLEDQLGGGSLGMLRPGR